MKRMKRSVELKYLWVGAGVLYVTAMCGKQYLWNNVSDQVNFTLHPIPP